MISKNVVSEGAAGLTRRQVGGQAAQPSVTSVRHGESAPSNGNRSEPLPLPRPIFTSTFATERLTKDKKGYELKEWKH